jgi:hypothetical protein
VEIHHEGMPLAHRQLRTEVERRGGLAHAAFLVEDRDYGHRSGMKLPGHAD